MERKEMTPAVENEVKNQVNNNKKMNDIINFANVFGEEAVAETKVVDQQTVKDLFEAFMSIPQEVTVRLKNDKGYLKMTATMNFREKYIRSYETYADAKLVECMLGAMKGNRINSLDLYKAEEHPLEASEVDPRIDLFRQFINSPLRCHFDADFIAGNGDRYVSATFNISYRKQIKFCLKRTEEIESIINEAVKAA